MKKLLVFTPDAIEELDEIKDYISLVLKNPVSANKIVNGILDEIERLSESPELGVNFVSKVGFPTYLRYLVVEKYIVVYRNEKDVVRVIHVFYGKRNYLKILFD
jgi:addiction module RelE/StbE family toxin